MYVALLAQITTIIAFLGIAFKPLRKVISKWLGELFTDQIRIDMNNGLNGLTEELRKDRTLNTRRHKANLRELKSIGSGLKVANNRIDELEEVIKQ